VALLLLLLLAADPVFDLEALRREPLESRTLSRSAAEGIVTEEVRFRSEAGVEIFGVLCYPEGAHGLPGFVWSPSGLGAASAAFPLQGARRGYVGLAIDYPVPGRRSTGAFPITDGLAAPEDPRSAPVYHGAVALLRAVQYLGSRAQADPARLAVLGSSWGGFFSTLVAGLEPRLRAAASLFGTGSLELGNPWWERRPPDAAARARWSTQLDPAARLATSRVPIAWISGTNDQFYWLPSLLATQRRAAGPRHLALLPGWNHAVDAALDEEAFAWLDVQLRGAPPLLAVAEPSVETRGARGTLRFRVSGPRAARSAEVAASFGEGAWPDRCWQVLPAQLHDGEAVAELGLAGLPGIAFGTVIDDSGFRSSTGAVQLPATPGAAPPACDGATAWGGFEDAALDYLQRHGLPVPARSETAQQGLRSARFEIGRHLLPPAFVTPGLPLRLELWVRSAAGPAQVAVTEDGARLVNDTSVGAQWVRLAVPVAPRDRALRATLEVTGGAVLVDEVSLRPDR
jgi:dienelactone hydrolase